MEEITSKLHACMGDKCYCRPGNEELWRWTEEDKQRLVQAVEKLIELEKV